MWNALDAAGKNFDQLIKVLMECVDSKKDAKTKEVTFCKHFLRCRKKICSETSNHEPYLYRTKLSLYHLIWRTSLCPKRDTNYSKCQICLLLQYY